MVFVSHSLNAILGPVQITVLGEHAASTSLVTRVPHDLPMHHLSSLEYEVRRLFVVEFPLGQSVQ